MLLISNFFQECIHYAYFLVRQMTDDRFKIFEISGYLSTN